MKISILAIAVLVPAASAFVAPQNPAFSTQLQSSTIPQAWSPAQAEAPPTAAWTPPAPAAAAPVASYAPLATIDEQRGQPLQVYEQIDRAAPGQWWKGAYSNDNIAQAGYEGYPSNKFALQRSRAQQKQQQQQPTSSSAIMRSIGSKPQPRQGRTWWMGVEGGIGYCQGGP